MGSVLLHNKTELGSIVRSVTQSIGHWPFGHSICQLLTRITHSIFTMPFIAVNQALTVPLHSFAHQHPYAVTQSPLTDGLQRLLIAGC